MMMSQQPIQITPKQEPGYQVNIVSSEPNPEELFMVLAQTKDTGKNSLMQQGNSFRNRNLPSSFFTPPEPRSPSHSHSNSIDSNSGQRQIPGLGGLPIHHSRAVSSPLPRNLGTSYSHQTQHGRQGSMDGFAEGSVCQTSQPLSLPPSCSNPYPYAGVTAGSGTKHAGGVKSDWSQPEPPTLTIDVNTLVQHGHQALNPNGIPQPFGVIMSLIGPLPPNWVPAATVDYEIYFINHNDKNTHWFPPLTPSHVSKCGPMKVFRPQMLSHSPQHPQQQQQAQQMSPASSQVSLASKVAAHGQPQQQQQQQPSPSHLSAPSIINGGALSPRNDQQILLELQRLHQERERLRYQQEIIQRKEEELREELKKGNLSIVAQANSMRAATLHSGGGGVLMHKNPAAAMVSATVVTNSMDPFLGRTALVQEPHARQNSADSGLGGMGAGYSSLPRTPEDYLANVDEMDSTDTVSRRQKQQLMSAQDFVDMTSMEIVDFAPVDSDELVPSLQDVPELTDMAIDGFNQWL